MAIIPVEWRASFGGPALTGHGGASIASIQSNGPAASVFDPANIGKVSPDDLLAVKSGEKKQFEVLPYAVWTFDLPFANANSAKRLGGVAYDSETGMIYIAQRCSDRDCSPVIHVMKLK